MAEKKSLLYYFLISLLYIAILSHILKGVVLSNGALILLILFAGLFCYFALRKAQMFVQNPLLSTVISIPFLFLIVLAKDVSNFNFSIKFRDNILSYLGILGFGALTCFIITFFIAKKSFILFRYPVSLPGTFRGLQKT